MLMTVSHVAVQVVIDFVCHDVSNLMRVRFSLVVMILLLHVDVILKKCLLFKIVMVILPN